jgi:NADP-dependent 3-hydroxy acid dehydrogenase YdfG
MTTWRNPKLPTGKEKSMNLHSRALSSEHAASAAYQGRLMDKVAVITGAASGIGKEIALAFAREGAKVVIADLDQKAAEGTASEIDPLGDCALGVAMDVSSEEQVEAGMARVIETFGRLDILISNAGVQIVAPLVEFEFAKWKKLLSIHLDGAFLTTRAALRQMYRQGSGSIIYMGSVHSKEASPLKAPYVTAKHGLIGLAKVVAKEGGAWSSCERHLSWFRPHAAGREADPRTGARARALGGGRRQDGNAEGDRRRRVHDRAGRSGGSGIPGGFPVERTHRPVGRGQPRMVHAVDVSERGFASSGGALR